MRGRQFGGVRDYDFEREFSGVEDRLHTVWPICLLLGVAAAPQRDPHDRCTRRVDDDLHAVSDHPEVHGIRWGGSQSAGAN